MKRKAFSAVFVFACFLLLVTDCFYVEADPTCKPSGKLRGKKPPKGKCNKDHGSDCCEEGKVYDIYECSPEVTNHTKATLTLNGFGWFNKKKRCFNYINIYGNGKSVKAKVVDECDSTMGCDYDHDYQPPCDNNIVDASSAVWAALGVPEDKGELEIYWSDA
ncbi:hypothetical protein PTKIN_Ptkin15bG0039400 [Pterospermum kingtungense]